MAENMIISALEIRERRARIVTDALHFSGSLELYRGLAEEGVFVTVLPAREGRIDYDELHDALNDDVALVAVSSISHYNGYEHDLRALSGIAHARGAFVYADVIQHVGVLPLDVAATEIDFCASASYKWLLGDMGLGFLYCRGESWRHLQRKFFGPRQHGDSLRPEVLDPSGHFHIGTLSASATEALTHSLPRTQAFVRRSPETIWTPLTQRIEERFGAMELSPLSPAGARAPIRSYQSERIDGPLLAHLRDAGMRVSGKLGYLRLSPSVFNTLDQIDAVADEMETYWSMR